MLHIDAKDVFEAKIILGLKNERSIKITFLDDLRDFSNIPVNGCIVDATEAIWEERVPKHFAEFLEAVSYIEKLFQMRAEYVDGYRIDAERKLGAK